MKNGSVSLSVLNGLFFGALAIVFIALYYVGSVSAVVPVATIGVFFGVFATVLVALLFWDALVTPAPAPEVVYGF